MTKKSVIIAVLIVLLLVFGSLFDLFGKQVTTTISEITKTQEVKDNNKPTIKFINQATYSICTDKTMLKQYNDLYLSVISSCTDANGKNILDKKHISYTEIDWTKKGKHEISYTIKDDYGHKIEKKYVITLTDPINTGH